MIYKNYEAILREITRLETILSSDDTLSSFARDYIGQAIEYLKTAVTHEYAVVDKMDGYRSDRTD